ncbi:hypothetical protein FHR83_007030 [Actinoplanes campanulatus]|uniref:Uncharacterized protein n=1 Tax=Actinoplanes campanulatus TaxID=113559 RepID=A0A7W5FI55_9ACTN|nr:hypothetical protein [Actinoplanes campanulatus]MBB3099324.1 hypothetical protein [Actinoplanes campanulatus]GGN40471.1 hypothetical protein GCM10010109_69610 [Actinoplanes campanulatus]
MTYRTGNHWGVTIVREGERTPEGHITGAAELVAVVVNGDQALAERICALLNGDGCTRVGLHDCAGAWRNHDLADGMPGGTVGDSCTCSAEPDPDCPVHQGRRARGPKPPNPPGCICDGSGRTCPRHGAVI